MTVARSLAERVRRAFASTPAPRRRTGWQSWAPNRLALPAALAEALQRPRPAPLQTAQLPDAAELVAVRAPQQDRPAG